MNSNPIIEEYIEGPLSGVIKEELTKKKNIALKGLSGSSDALVISSVQDVAGIQLIILHDLEEARFFLNDLQQVASESKVLLFPTSHKKPYQFEETENANVLQRAEVLTEVNKKDDKGILIVTYPEALTEKVINKKSLVENTLSAKSGDKLDIEFIQELLLSYDFEKTDFVYEAGQFAIRGGIIDIFSFAQEWPVRVELFGDEIDSIREFDPESQLSKDSIPGFNIVPDVQTKLLTETRQSFLSFLPEDTVIWLKDYRGTIDIVNKGFDKVSASFKQLMEESNNSQVVKGPEELYNSGDILRDELDKFRIAEFGLRYYIGGATNIDFETSPQPSFHKNFELLAENLEGYQNQGLKIFFAVEGMRQHERIQTILEEISPTLKFEMINLGLREGFVDKGHGFVCFTDHQIFDRYHKPKTQEKFTKRKALTLKELQALKPGDYVVHMDYGIGRFAGLDKVDNNGNQQEALRLVYRDDDLLYVSIHSLHKISRYSGKEDGPPAVNKLGSQDWENKKKKVKRKVKDIAKDLIALYAKRKKASGYSFPKDDFLQAELESSFMYQDTPDQAKSTEDVKADMELPHPMDRLVCGDVGFGKTEVAVRAAFKAVNSGKQVAVLVPTTILALQHFNTFKNRLENFPIGIEYINRFRTSKEITEIRKKVKSGEIDILIGTHRIVNKDVEFKDLGLMIIDEEQKFGVKVKERLKEMRVNVDALTLTATPIPRTLHFSLMGARDLSVISTPPPNRRPVTTELHEFSEEIIRDAISNEIRRAGQVFFVHNRVGDIENMANIILKLVPDARIGIAHGQMEGKALEKIMMKFIDGEYDVLVSTNIIESGLDIPNANTIIINRAHMFGLSDLHQMRGRVGRSNTKAYCHLITPPTSSLTSDARKRLQTLEEFSDLGDGFKVAMRDLDIRGAGNLLGSEQSGFINDMGFEMYHKILEEAVSELKESEFKELFEEEEGDAFKASGFAIDCLVETDLEILIPSDYVENVSERISLYSKLDSLKSEDELLAFKEEIKDRFGPYPEAVEDLIESVKLRWEGIRLGFERIFLKNNKLKCYIQVEGNDDYFQSGVFGDILTFVKSQNAGINMREYKQKLILTIEGIETIPGALQILGPIAKVDLVQS